MGIEGIISGKIQTPLKLMVYGCAGIGKTTFATSGENTVVLQTEDGSNEIGVDRFPVATTFSELEQYGVQLLRSEHSYKTVVIDSLDWLEKLIHNDLCIQYQATSITDDNCKPFSFGKGYGLALAQFARILKLCDMLIAKGLNIIFVAHDEIKRHEDPRCDGYDRKQPKLHKAVTALVTEWCDGVFFAGYEVLVRQTDGTFNKTVSKAQSTGERVLSTQESAAFVAKNRWNLPAELPLNYAAFIAAKEQGNV